VSGRSQGKGGEAQKESNQADPRPRKGSFPCGETTHKTKGEKEGRALNEERRGPGRDRLVRIQNWSASGAKEQTRRLKRTQVEGQSENLIEKTQSQKNFAKIKRGPLAGPKKKVDELEGRPQNFLDRASWGREKSKCADAGTKGNEWLSLSKSWKETNRWRERGRIN